MRAWTSDRLELIVCLLLPLVVSPSSESGVDESSGESLPSLAFSTPPPPPRDDGSSLAAVSFLSKRSAPYYSNFVDISWLVGWRAGQQIPLNAVLAMGRPLRRGDASVGQSQFVALWSPTGGDAASRRWGSAWYAPNNTVQAVFIDNGSIITTSQPDLAAKGFRILINKEGKDKAGFQFSWVLARDADPSSLLYAGNNQQVAAVFVDQQHNYDFAGSANWATRQMEYAVGGSLHSVGEPIFSRQVYVLTKQRCSCTC